MGFFKKIFGGKKKSIDLTESELIEAGACPNCWGMQEYENEYKAFSDDQTKANINHDKAHQKAFVQQFIETNITGIKLQRDGNQSVCLKCKTKYKHVSNHAN